MPIYAYKCESCGHAKDVLQKMSDPLLTDCPHCGAAAFKKQVTAAAFQLKGNGYYVTDFRDGGSATSTPAPKIDEGKSAPAPAADAKPAVVAAPAASTPAAAPAPAPSSSPAAAA